MDFYEVVNRRRTIRDFSDKAIQDEKIIRVLEAGLKAPTYNHLREWDYILVNDPEKRLQIIRSENLPDKYDIDKIRLDFSSHDSLMSEMYIEAIPKQKRMLLTSPQILIVVYKPKAPVAESSRIYDLNCLASVWCCIENILLAMAAEDLYAVTYIPQDTSGLKPILGIPADLEIAALIPFGYQADKARLPRQKGVKLEDKIHYNSWTKKNPM